MSDAKYRVAVVTGGSSGIGLAAAKSLASQGLRVYELSRGNGTDAVAHITADVTDENAVRSAIGEVVRREGRLDILICNAGSGISGAAEFTEFADAKAQFDVNLFGAVNAIRAATPHLRATHGRIVAVSSVAAALPVPFQAYYSASKAAVNALTLALRGELRPFGVSVCAVMPGDTATGFTSARRKAQAGDDVYGGRIARSVSRMERDEQSGMNADAVGRFVAKVALKRRVRPLYAAGVVYKVFVVAARLLPQSFVNWAVGKLYG